LKYPEIPKELKAQDRPVCLIRFESAKPVFAFLLTHAQPWRILGNLGMMMGAA
jgi:hypothetical protein